MASDTKEDVFAARTDIENTEKIYLDNGVYKKNTTLRSSWDLRIVHEEDQQVSGHGAVSYTHLTLPTTSRV